VTGATDGSARADLLEPTPADGTIARECGALTRYLVGSEPSPYVVDCYRRLLPSTAPRFEPDQVIDRALLGAAGAAPFLARIADAYARVARPRGLLRRRLTLLLAILENAPGVHQSVTSAITGSPPGVLTRLAGQLVLSGVALGIGILVFGPIQLAANRGSAWKT